MSKRNARLYLTDIRDAIEKIESYTAGMSFEAFAASQITIDAVVRNFTVIGEAAANMPDKFKEQHATIPWGKMMGMRNKVVHEYFGIDAKIVWKTIQEDIPELKSSFVRFEET